MSKSIFRIAGLIAVLTIISKFAGFLRDVFVAQAYGATSVSDAYFYAYQIPSLALILLGGLGGPFYTATVAVFSKIVTDVTQKPDETVKETFYQFVTITALVFGVLSVLVYIFSDTIIGLIISQGTPELIKIASMQLKIMSPMILIGGVIGIYYGVANVYREFFYTSLSPLMASITIIFALIFLPNDKYGLILAYSTLVGAVFQLILQLPACFRVGLFYRPSFSFSSNEMKQLGEILFPAMLGTTVGQINVYIDMFFTSGLEEGAWSAVSYGNKIFQFPVGVITTAFLVPLFPMFSSFVGQKDFSSLKEYFHKGLNSLWFLSFPVFALMAIFSYDAIKFLFERGAFDSDDTFLVSQALFFLSVSIIPYVARDAVTRVFYAFGDSKTPFLIAVLSIAVKSVMNFIFVRIFGVGGITLSTTIVTFFNMIMLGILIMPKINLEYAKFVKPLLKVSVSTFVMSVAGFMMRGAFLLGEESNLLIGIKLCVISIVCLGIFFVVSVLLKDESAYAFFKKVKARFCRG
ncbi:MAG TPA: murein biosynthesis integral membrane protein MurJ [Candidatus Adamsella sp.]|nr:murein biosynthesis integral membrane protein MurJ [Candidatus Adamsella sp.]